jgi:hypothetical protein
MLQGTKPRRSGAEGAARTRNTREVVVGSQCREGTVARVIVGEMATGGSPADDLRGTRAEMTFEKLFERCIEGWAKLHKRTWREDQAKYDPYLTPLAGQRISQIGTRHIEEIHARISKTKSVTANRVLPLVSSVFGRAGKWGLRPRRIAQDGERDHPGRRRAGVD